MTYQDTSDTIQEDVTQVNDDYSDGLNIDEATEALLKRSKDAHRPSKDSDEGEPSKEETTPEDTATEDHEEDTQEALDDHVVKVKVGDEEMTLKVKDLKRLAGQEAALTRKSQEAAELRKQVEGEAERYRTSLTKLVEKAQARWEPYSKVDLLVASKRLDEDQLQALREDMQSAWNDYSFLTQELDAEMQKARETHQAKLQESAWNCVQELRKPDSPYHIPNWSNEVYSELREFAVAQGIDRAAVDSETHPAVFKILSLAHAYTKAQKVGTSKVAKASPKKTITSTKAPSGDSGDGETRAKRRLEQSGSIDDAAAVLLQRARARKQ